MLNLIGVRSKKGDFMIRKMFLPLLITSILLLSTMGLYTATNDNLIINDSFSIGLTPWYSFVDDAAVASLDIDNNEAHFSITEPGEES